MVPLVGFSTPFSWCFVFFFFFFFFFAQNRNRDGQRAVLQGGALPALRVHLLAADPLVRRWACLLCAKLCEKCVKPRISYFLCLVSVFFFFFFSFLDLLLTIFFRLSVFAPSPGTTRPPWPRSATA